MPAPTRRAKSQRRPDPVCRGCERDKSVTCSRLGSMRNGALRPKCAFGSHLGVQIAYDWSQFCVPTIVPVIAGLLIESAPNSLAQLLRELGSAQKVNKQMEIVVIGMVTSPISGRVQSFALRQLFSASPNPLGPTKPSWAAEEAQLFPERVLIFLWEPTPTQASDWRIGESKAAPESQRASLPAQMQKRARTKTRIGLAKPRFHALRVSEGPRSSIRRIPQRERPIKDNSCQQREIRRRRRSQQLRSQLLFDVSIAILT